MLLHWPSSGGGAGQGKGTVRLATIDPGKRAKRIAAWKVLQHYYSKGWARAIGVSNFSEVHLQHLVDDGATIRPHVNQLEMSVYIKYGNINIVKYCEDNNIDVMASSPFGRGVMKMEEDNVLVSIAKKHGVSPGQVALAYILRQGYSASFFSTSIERMKGNINACNISLDEGDMEKLSSLQRSASWGLPSPYELP